jgi:hypothetical protein
MRTLALLIALSLLTSCKAQEKNSTTTQKIKTMERPSITAEFEKLNLDDFKDGLVIKKENIEIEENKWIIAEKYYYDKLNDYGRKILDGSFLQGFSYNFYPKKSHYIIGKSYYINNYILGKCILSNINSSLTIGKEYFFDQDGKLEKTIDHDLGWDYSYEKVIEYILDRKAPLQREDIYWGAEITQHGSAKKYWQLIIDTGMSTGKSTWELLKLDAMSGEILYQIEFEGNRVWHADLGANNPVAKQRIIVADKTLDKQKK